MPGTLEIEYQIFTLPSFWHAVWQHRIQHTLPAIKNDRKAAYPGLLFTNLVQYIPRNMHTVLALLCFVVVTHWLIFPYPSGLLHWHCGNLTIASVPAKQTWWIWIITSCEFIMNACITTTKQSTTKPCAYFLGYTVSKAPCGLMNKGPGRNTITVDCMKFPTFQCGISGMYLANHSVLDRLGHYLHRSDNYVLFRTNAASFCNYFRTIRNIANGEFDKGRFSNPNLDV